ncbi:hypothetical protein [Natroniella sp. ANB-PHB2]|uniref:hypothetical protein n=1 Tax=Natroniella sp. ANB-PHB2 TaxID=3384444 RepID=UPI0038D49BE5
MIQSYIGSGSSFIAHGDYEHSESSSEFNLPPEAIKDIVKLIKEIETKEGFKY